MLCKDRVYPTEGIQLASSPQVHLLLTSWMLRIDGERKRQGWLRLCVVRGQSRGQNASSDTKRKIVPAVQLGGLAPLTNYIT